MAVVKELTGCLLPVTFYVSIFNPVMFNVNFVHIIFLPLNFVD